MFELVTQNVAPFCVTRFRNLIFVTREFQTSYFNRKLHQNLKIKIKIKNETSRSLSKLKLKTKIQFKKY